MAAFRTSRKPRLSRKTKKRIFFFSLVFFLAISLQSFLYVERNLAPALMEIAKIRVTQIATQAINDAISKKIAQGANFKELIDFVKDNDGKISMMMFNTTEYARIVGETTARVEHSLARLEESGDLTTIPIGQALNSNILAEYGPHVPITLVPKGAASVNLYTKTEQSGINMVLVTAYVQIVVEVKVVIPFATDATIVKNDIPISSALVVGNVPQFYYDGNGNAVGKNNSAPNINFGPSINQPGTSGQGK